MDYHSIEASSDAPLPRVFRPFLTPDGTARFVVAGPVRETSRDGINYRVTGDVGGKFAPNAYGPRIAFDAMAAPTHAMPKTLDGADLLFVLDAAKKHLAERFVPANPGAIGNDVRTHVALDAARFLTAQGIPAHMAVAALDIHDEAMAANVEASCDVTAYGDGFAKKALKYRDDIVKARLAEVRAAKKVDVEAQKINARTNRELGVFVFTNSVTDDPCSAFGPALIVGSERYWRFSLASLAWLPIVAAQFPKFRMMGDDEVVPAQVGKLHAPTAGYSENVANFVLKSRIGRIDTRPIEETEFVTDALEKEWRFKLAEAKARPWCDVSQREIAVSAMIRGLLLPPADVEEELLTWGEADRIAAGKHEAPEHAKDYEAQRREGIRAAIARAMSGELSYHSPGELYVAPTKAQLDALAKETKVDTWGRVLGAVFGSSTRVSADEAEKALREAGELEGATQPTTRHRIVGWLRKLGFAHESRVRAPDGSRMVVHSKEAIESPKINDNGPSWSVG